MRLADIPVVPAAAVSDCTGAEVFALQVLGVAMQPEFDPGDVVVVEPDGLATDGSFVVAFAGGDWVLRRLARRADGWFLETLNPAAPDACAPIPMPDFSCVRGVVIQKSRPGRRRATKRYVE